MSIATTLQPGPDSDARRVIANQSSTPAPTSGVEGHHFQGGQFLHVYVEFLGGATQALITPWYWSEIAQQWFAGNQLTFTAAPDVRFALVQAQGEHRVYLRLDSVTGGTINAWAAFSDDSPQE